MDGNLYEVLLGAAPTDPEKQKMTAEQLRRRRSFGELGALTGDRVLQPFGQNLMKQADTYAQDIQGTRQKDIDDAQTKQYQEGQLSHMREMEALTKRGQTLDHIYQMMMAQAAQLKAEKTGNPKIPKLRQGDITDLQNIAQDINQFNELESFIKEGNEYGAVEVGGIPIPGARQLKNFAAGMGIGTEKDKKAFAMKQQFDRLYTIGARNRLFGATLTPNEQRAWANANPDVRQTDAQLKEALPILRKIFERRLKNKASGLIRENYDPDAIAEYADLGNLGLDIGQGAMQGHQGPAPKRVKVDAAGNPLGN